MAGPLAVSGVTIAVPAPAGDVQALFTSLGTQFRIDAKVTEYLVSQLKLESLEDLATLFTKEDEVGAVVERVPELEEGARLLQTARLRQAWAGVKAALAVAAGSKKRGEEDPDLDNPLPQQDLDNIEDLFWRRYHLTPSADVMPADALLSRVSRGVARRLLTLRDVWKVQVVAQQLKSERRKTDLGQNLALVEEAVVPHTQPAKTVVKYLELLWTLLLAYGKAGSAPVPNAPTDGEPRGSDTTRYVQVPLDVLAAYHRRAHTFAHSLPHHVALETLRARDEEERRVWIDKFRPPGLTLGQVIQSVFDRREGLWAAAPPPLQSDGGADRSTKRKVQEEQGGGRALPSNKQTPCCTEWNAGACSEPCPFGFRHACSAPLKVGTGKCCNLTNHRAIRCKNKKKA